MSECEKETEQLLLRLTEEEPRTCSIRIFANGGEVEIDQSMDMTIRGDQSKAREGVLFLFPYTAHENGEIDLGLNRDFIRSMQVLKELPFHAEGSENGFRVRFLASHDPNDIGHLINAFLMNGGVMYFDRGVEVRNGKR